MIGAYLTETVTVKYLAAMDKWQTPTWTTATVRARIEQKDRLIYNSRGEQTASSAVVYLPGDITEPTTEDRIVIGAVEYPILRVDKISDFSACHYEVYLYNERR